MEEDLFTPEIRKPGLIISFCVAVIATIMFCLAFASPNWAVRHTAPERFGIWRACRDGVSGSNCTTFNNTPEFKDAWQSSNDTINMSFVLTCQVFSATGMLFLIFSLTFYCLCFWKYTDWFLSMACGFEFFTGILSVICSMVWQKGSLRFAYANSWANIVCIVSGCIFVANGLVYAVAVCSGTCYVTRGALGIKLRGDAEVNNKAKKKKASVMA